MKHILTILAGCCISATVANAQIDQSPGNWGEFTRQRIAAPPTAPPPASVVKPSPLPPVQYDHEYKGKLTIVKWMDFSLIRMICKDAPTANACSYHTYYTATGEPVQCIILLGPGTHDDPRVLRHEIGHCNGWSAQHEGAR